MKKKERNIGLELLRIISMLMIILLHSIDHSGLLENLVSGSMLYWYEWFIYALVQVCVNCFVLISGYFLVKSKFRFEKLAMLWIEVVFYALIIKIIMMALGEIPFSITSLISCFVPILTGRYWFVTIYFGMYLLSPFLNIGIKAMSKRQHTSLVVLLILLFSAMVSIHPSFRGMNSGGGWGVAWFIVLYIIAAYIRLYYKPNGKILKPIIVFFACPILMIGALWIADKSGIGILTSMADNWWKYDSLPAFIASIALLITFLNRPKELNNNKIKQIIIRMSSATFGVYLIHAHANICTESMWQRIGMVSNMNKLWFPLYQIMVVIVIFLACGLIDILRQWLFQKLNIKRLIDRIFEKIPYKYIYEDE
jgi:surface polysaccharide O-acyltransferase-like enzyme